MKTSLILIIFACYSAAQTPAPICATGYPIDTRNLTGILRDVWPCSAGPAIGQYTCGTKVDAGQPTPICTNPQSGWECAIDFERYTLDDIGMVQAFLDPILRVPLINPLSQHPSVINTTQFTYWYQNMPLYNIQFPFSFVASNENTCSSLVYTYSNQNFFPLDGRGFGNQFNSKGTDHNYAFTLSINLRFTYQGNEVFSFEGDDDVFVFINNQLALDLGGAHPAEAASLNLQWPTGGCAQYTIPSPPPPCSTKAGAPASVANIPCACLLGITGPGNSYAFDLYYNERHTDLSDLKFTTSLFLQCPIFDRCGVCQGDGQSCCKCPSIGPCFTSRCDIKTGACIYAPKMCPQSPDICHSYSCNNGTGNCDLNTVVCADPAQVCTPTSCCGVGTPGCDDNNPCTIDSCTPMGCAHTLISCDDGNACTDDKCNIATGNCTHSPTPVPASNRCVGSYCDPRYGIVSVTTQCPAACTGTCDPVNGCQGCPGDPFGLPAQIGTGIGAGAIAGIAIAGAAAIVIGVVGSKKGYDVWAKHKNNMNAASSNPLYKDEGLTGVNPLHV